MVGRNQNETGAGHHRNNLVGYGGAIPCGEFVFYCPCTVAAPPAIPGRVSSAIRLARLPNKGITARFLPALMPGFHLEDASRVGQTGCEIVPWTRELHVAGGGERKSSSTPVVLRSRIRLFLAMALEHHSGVDVNLPLPPPPATCRLAGPWHDSQPSAPPRERLPGESGHGRVGTSG